MPRFATLLTWLLLCSVVHAQHPPRGGLEVERLNGATPKNVIIILSDDHRYDAMSFLDHQLAVTPTMDRMAAEGVHFENALVTTSLCSPSRASILTGHYTFRHRVIDNQRAIPEGTRYFPEYLQEAGYNTAFFGKWHMGGESDQPQPGWNHWVSFRGQGHYLSPSEDYTLNVNGARVHQRGYITDEITDYAVDWLREQNPSEQPFFLYLGHKAVHANFTPAERHEGLLDDVPWERPEAAVAPLDDSVLLPRWLRDQRNSWHGVDFPYHSELDIERYYKRYCETLMAVDDSIARILATLEDMGITEDTLVIYTSDNGFMFGEHGLIDKRVAYETSIRVPMLLWGPGTVESGLVVEEPVANIDLAPTVMEAMGLAAPDDFDGLSFLPLAQGQSVPWRDFFLYVYYWEKNYPQSPTVFALRGERYKYINYYGIWDVDELFDLQEDPGETNNLLYDPAYAELARSMEATLYSRMAELGGMEIPLNPPRGGSSNRRYRPRGGDEAASFPEPLVEDEPLNTNAQ